MTQAINKWEKWQLWTLAPFKLIWEEEKKKKTTQGKKWIDITSYLFSKQKRDFSFYQISMI